MNRALSELAAQVGLSKPESEWLRLAFGLACASRIEHLLEDPRAVFCLGVLREFVAGKADAACYAAYASVYAYGGYGINDPSAFEAEFAWQVEQLGKLAAGPTDDSIGSPAAPAEFQR